MADAKAMQAPVKQHSAALHRSLRTSAARERFSSLVRKAVYDRVSSSTITDCLTLRLMSGARLSRTLPPAASMDYVRTLIAFMRHQQFGLYTVDSYLTPITIAAVEAAVNDFVADARTRRIFQKSLSKNPTVVAAGKSLLRGKLQAETKWLKTEITGSKRSAAAAAVIDATAAAVAAAVHSAAGTKVTAVVAKLAATSAGKVVAAKYLPLLVAKIVGSAAFKSAITLLIKKVGVSALVKTAIGKAIIVGLLGAGATSIPLAWFIVPIIAAVLIYDVATLPRKLGEKVSVAVSSDLADRYGEITEKIAVAFATATTRRITLRRRAPKAPTSKRVR